MSPLVATFAFLVVFAFLAPPTDLQWWLVGAILAAAALAAAAVLRWEALPAGLDPVPLLLMIVAVLPLRHGAGGAQSGYAPLVLLAILWLSLYGTRLQMATGVALASAVLVIPILVVGAPEYPFGEWRRAAVLALIGGLTGLMIQRLTAEIRAQGAAIAGQKQEIEAQAEATRAILESAGDAIVSCDDRGRIVGINDAAARILGRSEAELRGRDLIDTLVAPAERERIWTGFAGLLEESASEPRTRRLETEVIGADGQTVPVEITATVTWLRGTRSIHVFARDISARQTADEAARQHLDDLGRLLAVARDLDGPTAGRNAICEAARDLAQADLALFFEAKDQALVATGSAGDIRLPVAVALDGRTSLTAHVVQSGETTFVGDLLADPRVDHDAAIRLRVRAAHWQPILREGRAIGILIVYWHEPRPSLTPRVASLLELFATQAAVVVERADLITRLEDLARTDDLTGLANRRALDEALVRALAVAERAKRPITIALLDLDRFKDFNDSHGHQAGDRLLRSAARAWLTALRPSDTLARFGGEEFLVVIPDADLAAGMALVERLRSLVPERQTVSAGVAAWDGQEAMAELVARADAALYRAKGRGRNQVVAAAPGDPEPPTRDRGDAPARLGLRALPAPDEERPAV